MTIKKSTFWFIPCPGRVSCVDIASPLNELTKKGFSDKPQTTKKRKKDYYVPFIGTKNGEASFQTLKQKLREDPMIFHVHLIKARESTRDR